MLGQTRSTSFSFGQGPAKQPAFGTGAPGGTTQQTFSFGQPAASTAVTSAAPATGGLFGANTSGQAAGAAPGGLFGAQPQQQPTTSTFGTTAKPLFGQVAAKQPQQQGSSLFNFGQPNQQQQPQQPGQQQTGGGLFGGPSLFGASTAAGASAPIGGLFGQPAQQQQQQPQQGGGLFSAFGQRSLGVQPQQQQQQLGQSQFGQPQLGQSQLGTSQLGQQVHQGGSHLTTPFAQHPFYQKERYNDLPVQAKQMVEQLDTFIQCQTKLRDELKSADLGAEVAKSSQGIRHIRSELKSLAMMIESDLLVSKDLQDHAEMDRADSNTLFEIARNFHHGGDNDHLRMFPRMYFSRAAAEFSERVQRYRATVEGIERQISSIGHRDEHSPQAIENAIHAQNTSFMALAAQVAAIHSEIEKLRDDYTRWYQQQHQSARDPFSMKGLGTAVTSS
ncbi:hypothetical protein K437DRAFT_259803 [Tilletiaria anomala UBC 951]|uniref:Nucleoporin Nup54 alpha-helical domain-containing protein n=1 Tax=Tilletiaria anomala (strain ATCC 24038 / CBS 436.72 / UBC 951) TaxID=1037660 RepID=A0A066VAV4_TILAU|nr:uncharacterized protein K437DRAFT_259803 [Tilletiaria anomala UBC 951]KDN37418.1 hypothetical protein K437DRAFT_259803 [Tilletiaria anomala UBC 951]